MNIGDIVEVRKVFLGTGVEWLPCTVESFGELGFTFTVKYPYPIDYDTHAVMFVDAQGIQWRTPNAQDDAR